MVDLSAYAMAAVVGLLSWTVYTQYQTSRILERVKTKQETHADTLKEHAEKIGNLARIDNSLSLLMYRVFGASPNGDFPSTPQSTTPMNAPIWAQAPTPPPPPPATPAYQQSELERLMGLLSAVIEKKNAA